MSQQAVEGEERRIFRRTSLSTTVVIRIEDPSIPEREMEGAIVNIGWGGILARVGEGLAEGGDALRGPLQRSGNRELRSPRLRTKHAIERRWWDLDRNRVRNPYRVAA